MAQYYPAGRTGEFPEIDRHLYRTEFARALVDSHEDQRANDHSAHDAPGDLVELGESGEQGDRQTSESQRPSDSGRKTHDPKPHEPDDRASQPPALHASGDPRPRARHGCAI